MGPILFLSLFLLLLAFFILLNALSTLEETKSRAVISSVAATFQTETQPDISAEILISTLGPVPEPEEVTEELERLWLTAVPITRTEIITPGRVMQVLVPVSEIFIGGEATVRGDRSDLVRATARALSARLEGFVVSMQAVAGTTSLTAAQRSFEEVGIPVPAPAVPPEELPLLDLDDPGASLVREEAPDTRDLSFARMTTFAGALVEGGAPPAGLSVGIQEGESRYIRIRFDIHPAENAYSTFSGLSE